MTVEELKNALEKLPKKCDSWPVVSMQAKTDIRFNGSSDELVFAGIDDIELKRVNIAEGKIRIN